MFNIPVKKLKGVETGTFVVLNQDALPESENCRTEVQNKLFLGYVVNDDYMRNGKFAKIIPIIYDVHNDRYQHTCREMHQRMYSYIFPKDQLKAHHDTLEMFSDDAIDYDEENDGPRVSAWRIKNAIRQCNYSYNLSIKVCSSLEDE